MLKSKKVGTTKQSVFGALLLIGSIGLAYAGTSTYNPTSGSTHQDSDGYMTSGYRSSISAQHSATDGDGQHVSDTYMTIRALHNGSGYYLARVWLGFDISNLISTSSPKVIDSATLTLYKDTGGSYANDSSLSVQLVPFDSTQTNPSYIGEFGKWFSTGYAFYGALATPVAFSSFSTGNATVITLNSNGLSYLTNATNGGFIKLGVVTDVDEQQGTISSGQDNILGFSSADNSTAGLRPVLTVVWHLASVATPSNATNTPLNATTSLVSFSYVASSTTAYSNTSCATFDVGCYFVNGMAYLFVPSSDSVSQFQNLNLASTSPFSYAYDMGNLYSELLNTSTSSTLSFSLPFIFAGTTTASVTLISHTMLTNSTLYPTSTFVTSLIRTLLIALIWFGLAQFIYRQILKSHNKETTT